MVKARHGEAQVPEEQHPNTLLALLWAGLTNVSVNVFWAVAFLLLPEHAHWRHSVQQQMAVARAAVTQGFRLQDTVDVVVRGALGQGEVSVLHGCVSEALRLRAQGVFPPSHLCGLLTHRSIIYPGFPSISQASISEPSLRLCRCWLRYISTAAQVSFYCRYCAAKSGQAPLCSTA